MNVARRRGPPVVGRKRKFRSLSRIMKDTASNTIEDVALGGRRKWDELDVDCLINVFGRIGMESLILYVPYVCTSWKKAALDPLSWQKLSFPEFLPLREPKSLGLEQFYYNFVDKFQVEKFSIDGFVKKVVDRSEGKAVEIKLPGFITEETLRYVSDASPGLRVLSMPDDMVVFRHCRVIAEVIGKWKLLEELHLGGNLKKISQVLRELDYQRKYQLFAINDNRLYETILDKILVEIGNHCKQFKGLRIAHGCVNEIEASIIVESLPNLRYLWTDESRFEGDSRDMLVRGCKHIEVLDVSECEDFDYKNSLTLRLRLLTRMPAMSTGGLAPRWHLATR